MVLALFTDKPRSLVVSSQFLDYVNVYKLECIPKIGYDLKHPCSSESSGIHPLLSLLVPSAHTFRMSSNQVLPSK